MAGGCALLPYPRQQIAHVQFIDQPEAISVLPRNVGHIVRVTHPPHLFYVVDRRVRQSEHATALYAPARLRRSVTLGVSPKLDR